MNSKMILLKNKFKRNKLSRFRISSTNLSNLLKCTQVRTKNI